MIDIISISVGLVAILLTIILIALIDAYKLINDYHEVYYSVDD